ncbi:MAG TPA: FAD-dependent oxidoreductase, partial [Mycobacterium sp.]
GADRARRSGTAAIRIGYPTVDLDALYLEPARRVMAERGVDVRVRTRAVSVAVDGERASGVRLADGSIIEADAVVLAVPSWNLRSLLDDVPGSEDIRLAAKQLEAIPIMNAYVLLDRPLGTAAAWESLLDSDIGWVFDRDHMHGPRADGNHLYALTTCAAYDLMELKNAAVTDRLVAALRASYPAARDARVVDVTVVPWPKATFSSRVGMSTIRPGNRTVLTNLALAGDWTHNDWPTTMEGAAQSASRAVDLIHGVLTTRVRPGRAATAHRVAPTAE